MDEPGSLWPQIFVIILLTVINAIFAASEMAFVSLNQTKMTNLAEEGNKKAKRVLDLLQDSDDFLATIQVAITLAGFLSSASAATSFANRLSGVLKDIPAASTVAIVLVTMILSYLSLVLGELYPKQIALQMPEEVAMFTSGFVAVVKTIFKPFVWLLSTSTDLLQKITPIEFSEIREKFTRDEMKAILQESRKEGSIDLAEFTMLQGVLSLDTKLAREVMVPRTDTEMLDIEDDYQDILNEILDSPFSRLPIYEEDKDNVIGVIHVKNVLKQLSRQDFSDVDFRQIMSDPLFVPSTIFIDDLLVEFKREQTHLAILRDEYGGVEGIVTLEDILEEIVGEIEDESDIHDSSDIRKIDKDNYYLNGVLPLDKFNQYFDEKLESDEVDTIAGLIIYHLGYVQDDDERIMLRCNQWVLTTSHIENGRIRGIHVQRDPDYHLDSAYDLTQNIDEIYYERDNVVEHKAEIEEENEADEG